MEVMHMDWEIMICNKVIKCMHYNDGLLFLSVWVL